MDARKGGAAATGVAQPIVIRRLTTRPRDLRSEGRSPRTVSPSARLPFKVRHHRSHPGQRDLFGSSSGSTAESTNRRLRAEEEEGGGGRGGGGSVDGIIDDSSGNEAFEEEEEEEKEDSSPPPLQRRPLYVDCAETGQRRFRLEFDAEGFAAEDTTVTLTPHSRRLEIRAVQEETRGGRKSTSEFSRRIKIPEDVDTRQMACVVVDGRIRVDAPLLPLQVPAAAAAAARGLPRAGVPHRRPSSPPARRCDPLNAPVVRCMDGESKTLTLCVEVGRVFRADDVSVRCRGAEQLIVSAEREEATERSRLTASLVREFDLPERIDPQTLRAGITPDGLLKITAQVLWEEEKDAKNTKANGISLSKEA